MRWFDSYDIGALVACTLCVIVKPDIYTPFIWAAVFLIINNVLALFGSDRPFKEE